MAGWRRWSGPHLLNTHSLHTHMLFCLFYKARKTQWHINKTPLYVCFTSSLFTLWKRVCMEREGEWKRSLCSVPSFVNKLGQQPPSARLGKTFLCGFIQAFKSWQSVPYWSPPPPPAAPISARPVLHAAQVNEDSYQEILAVRLQIPPGANTNTPLLLTMRGTVSQRTELFIQSLFK